jgi:hypothetical protein
VGPDFVFSLIGARRGLSKVFSALLVLAALLVGAEARAAVPMCSQDGRTIAAPPIGWAARGLVLEAPPPCPKASPLATRSLPSEPSAPGATDAPCVLRVVPVGFTGVAAPASARLAVETEILALPRGAVRTIDRPPRA